MKLKTPIVLGLSLCMLTGVAFSAAACGETGEEKKNPTTHTEHVDSDKDGKCDDCGAAMPDTSNPGGENPGGQGNQNEKTKTYSVTVSGADTTILANMSVLFFSKEGSKELKELRGTTSASVELDAGDYTAYLVGDMPGYTQTPVKLTSSAPSGTIKVSSADPIPVPGHDAYGNPETSMKIYYQLLVLLPDGKTVYFGPHTDNPDANWVQICTYSGDGVDAAMCYNAYFDSETGLAWHNNDEVELDWETFPQEKHQVHFSTPEEWPEGCTFDNEKYILSEKGGFFTIRFDKA